MSKHAIFLLQDFVLPAEGIVSGVNRNEVETARGVLESGVCNEGLEQNFGKMVIRNNATLRYHVNGYCLHQLLVYSHSFCIFFQTSCSFFFFFFFFCLCVDLI